VSKSISLHGLRRNLSQVMGEVAYGGETYIIDSYGRPTAALISIDAYRQLSQLRDDAHGRPAGVISPRLVDPAQLADFELEVLEDLGDG
jgi:prevent-host-death family protein